MKEVGFFLLDVPPSLNRVGSQGNWRKWHRFKTQWQRDIETWLMTTDLPRPVACARVYVKLRFPTRRRRDTGNFQALLEKSIGDALVNGGWLVDDTPELYRFERLEFEQELGPPRTAISVVYDEVSS